ncbi:hypothetical protein Pelo_14909 [Pelomyxa schiedti]|nr:hypothetical protein Pelo_14909 [Pelomyxa schiedti]
MDSARTQTDQVLASGGDSFVALLSNTSGSMAYSLRPSLSYAAETSCPAGVEPATQCVDSTGAGTVTLCGDFCVTPDIAILIAYGYASAPLSGTALFGAISQNALSPPTAAAVAVLMGVYLRSRYTDALLAENTPRMCTLLKGERFNIMPKLLFTGMCGDIYAQDALYSAEGLGGMTIAEWESQNSAVLCDLTESLLYTMRPESMGTWMSLVGVSGCAACASVFNAPSLAPISHVPMQSLRGFESGLKARDVTTTCDSFPRTSSDWATCNRWGVVVHSTTSPAVDKRAYSVRADGNCLLEQLNFKTLLEEMAVMDSICVPSVLAEFTSQLEVILELCACPSFIEIARPLLSFGQVLCNSQPVYTNVTGEQCFKQLVLKIVDIPRLDLVILPVCIPCASEILGRENMGLAYDMMCQIQMDYWGPTDSSCMGVFNETLGDPSIPALPSDCLVPLTSSGDIVEGWDSTDIPSYCADIYVKISNKLRCCCNIYNDMLEIRGYRAGLDGLVCSPCSEIAFKMTIGVSGFDWDQATSNIGVYALQQMAQDELSHRLPVVSRPDFIQGVTIAKAAGGKRDNIDASIEVTYQTIYDDAAIEVFDEVVEGDTLVEMTDFISNATEVFDTVVITSVEISCESPDACPSMSNSLSSSSVPQEPSSGSSLYCSLGFAVLSVLVAFLVL